MAGGIRGGGVQAGMYPLFWRLRDLCLKNNKVNARRNISVYRSLEMTSGQALSFLLDPGYYVFSVFISLYLLQLQ